MEIKRRHVVELETAPVESFHSSNCGSLENRPSPVPIAPHDAASDNAVDRRTCTVLTGFPATSTARPRRLAASCEAVRSARRKSRAEARRQVIGRYYLKKSADRLAWSGLMTAMQSNGVKIVARQSDVSPFGSQRRVARSSQTCAYFAADVCRYRRSFRVERDRPLLDFANGTPIGGRVF